MLSAAQHEAVTSEAARPLQILAGPGSGKTRVLTSRVAHLVRDSAAPIAPERCVVVTFTNRAANEMRARLETMIGADRTRRLVLGTFHAVCVRFLRRWGTRLGLDPRFTIADTDDARRLLRDVDRDAPVDATLAAISRAKAHGWTPDELRASAQHAPGSPAHTEHLALCRTYAAYQQQLRTSHALDFDDLLLLGVRLFREHPELTTHIDHVLVDEFQDTNAVQYELLRRLSRHVSVVGDPDQSIYSWRHADVRHIERMHLDFPGLHRVLLEENYRSTPQILEAALRVMQQDPHRIPKGLYTALASGPPVSVVACHDADDEALFVAREIRQHARTTPYAHMSVLLRLTAHSRAFESIFHRLNIPYRLLGGVRFFDRAEVRDLLAYLTLADNPAYTPAVLRVLNVPKRGIGPQSAQQLANAAQHAQVPLLTHLAHAHALRPALLRAVRSFVDVVHELHAQRHAPVADLLHRVLHLTRYEEHLRQTSDADARWDHVQELIHLATASDDLSSFLESSALASDVASDTPCVTISTCHAAKGLEWPIVFLPAIEHGIFPFYRCTTPDEHREERRLLYVAMTRAQRQLYVSWAHRRLVLSEWSDRSPSPFLAPLVDRAPPTPATPAQPPKSSAAQPRMSPAASPPASPAASPPPKRPRPPPLAPRPTPGPARRKTLGVRRRRS